jgi:acyl-CoA thioesterase-2
MPHVPPPESLRTVGERYNQPGAPVFHRLAWPFDLRYVDDPSWEQRAKGPRGAAPHRIWMKATGRLPDDPLLHACCLTFASDLTLLDSILARHGLSVQADAMTMASLDHAVWFHRPFRADEWLLYVHDSPSASGGRGLATGNVFTRDGLHIATVVQEGMIRLPAAGGVSP